MIEDITDRVPVKKGTYPSVKEQRLSVIREGV
jgi:hypothetical protein